MSPNVRTTLSLIALAVALGTIASPALARSVQARGANAASVLANRRTARRSSRSAGCVACHTLKAAGAKGTVGPNLDSKKTPYAKIITQVTNGGKIMSAFKSRLSKSQIQDVAAFVYTSTHK